MENPHGDLLKGIRLRHGLTQVRLAELLQVNSNYLARVERGKHIPSDQFMAHAQLLDWTLTVISQIEKGAIIEASYLPTPPIGRKASHPSDLHYYETSPLVLA